MSFARYLHVSKWLLSRVRSIVSAYDLACQDISWIDSDDDGSDEEMLDVLEMHRAVCGSLYCDYSLAVQKAFTAEPTLVSPMFGSLVFALEMVMEIETPFQRHADMFFFDILQDRVCNEIQMAIRRSD